MIRVGRAFKVKEINILTAKRHTAQEPYYEKYLAARFNFEGVVDGSLSKPIDVDMMYIVALLRMAEYGIRPEEFAYVRLSDALSTIREDYIYNLRAAVLARKEKMLTASAYDQRERTQKREQTWHYGNTHRSFKEEMKKPR